jgi:hypothetical protein
VFRAADAYFIRFTSGAYSLTMGEGDDTDLFAVDTATGGVLTLDQLSSGTRVQLLLAVRLAFIDVTERGARLPVILDEALGNTDDTRATAIIDAAIEIAREGRQVLYFTAQHDEIGKWLARLNAHNHAPVSSVIDLEAIRASAQTQSSTTFEWDESIFALDSIDPLATYDDLRGLLSVPPIDLWAETTDGHHVWYFITHPEALVKLHDRGIRLWGQYGALSRASRLEGIATSTTHAKAQARAKVIETVCREWRYGRPRPLTIERLHESGLITPRFWDDVVACAASKAWDGGALITALQNREISGFFRTTTESLENWLREYGHIADDIAPRPDAMIRAAAMSAGDATGILDPDETDALLLTLTGAALTAPLAQSAGLQVATAKMP